MARKRKTRYHRSRKSQGAGRSEFPILLVAGAIFILGLIFTFSLLIQAAKPGSGGGYDVTGGCAGKTTRPCYDKLTSSSVNVLGKNGQNTFTACISNAAPNKVGEVIHKTSVCGQEIVEYCHDGKSSNFIRKFNGNCSAEPPLPPPPSPEPSPTPGPISDTPFRITYPNGGEQLPFGSEQVVRWEGGDTINEWPIYLSIVDRDLNVAIREMVIGTQNDGAENWIVDLPLGNYYVYYGQGCRNVSCISPSQWDQSDNKFSVVAGAPLGKITSDYPLNQSLVVLSPSGGEVWDSGSTQPIKWSGKSATTLVNLSVYDANSTVSIVRDTANDGVHDWLVPGFIPPGQYKISLQCSNCAAPPSGFTNGNWNYSFYPFTIK